MPARSEAHRRPGPARTGGVWMSAVIAAYPRDWRRRYGEELEALIGDLRQHGVRPLADVRRPGEERHRPVVVNLDKGGGVKMGHDLLAGRKGAGRDSATPAAHLR